VAGHVGCARAGTSQSGCSVWGCWLKPSAPARIRCAASLAPCAGTRAGSRSRKTFHRAGCGCHAAWQPHQLAAGLHRPACKAPTSSRTFAKPRGRPPHARACARVDTASTQVAALMRPPALTVRRTSAATPTAASDWCGRLPGAGQGQGDRAGRCAVPARHAPHAVPFPRLTHCARHGAGSARRAPASHQARAAATPSHCARRPRPRCSGGPASARGGKAAPRVAALAARPRSRGPQAHTASSICCAMRMMCTHLVVDLTD